MLSVIGTLAREKWRTEVGSHAEVGQASSTEDDDGELVEQTRAAGCLKDALVYVDALQEENAYEEVQADVDDQEEGDEGERSPQPVRAMSADVEGGIWWVEVQSVVAGHSL